MVIRGKIMRQPVYDAHMYERRNFNEGICSIYADRLNPLGTGGGNNAHVPCKLQRGPGEGGEELGKYTPEVEFKRQNHSTGFSSGMFFPGTSLGNIFTKISKSEFKRPCPGNQLDDV